MSAGASPFGKRVGGSLCLDFVNTVRARVSRGTRRGRDFADVIVGERLVSYDALLRWGTFAGILAPRQVRLLSREAVVQPANAAAVHARACEVREAMYRIFKAAIEGWTPHEHDLAILNREIHVARTHEHVVASPAFGWAFDEHAALDRMLWPIVRSAADLLTSDVLPQVRQCPGEECGWLFLDTSRSRRRQWCDMAECGNLAKVRRFRQHRHAASGSSGERP